jgi:hypothetical protein
VNICPGALLPSTLYHHLTFQTNTSTATQIGFYFSKELIRKFITQGSLFPPFQHSVSSAVEHGQPIAPASTQHESSNLNFSDSKNQQ